jgi:preprotein translocase subunit Sec61beta
MMVGLLLLLILRARPKLPAGVAGYLSFLLSSVRTAWLSWFIGLFLILRKMKPRALVRICLSIVLLLAGVLPFASDPRVATLISDRVSSFTDLGHDASFADRVNLYQTLLTDVFNTPFGDGLKNRETSRGLALDSGILIALFSLGWLGAFLYGAGVLSIFVGEERSLKRLYPFSVVTKAIAIAILMQLIGGNIFVNITGAMFWTFAGLYLSARKHHSDQMAA